MIEFTTCCAQAARQGTHLIEGLTVGKFLGQGFQVTPHRAAVCTPFAVCETLQHPGQEISFGCMTLSCVNFSDGTSESKYI